MHNSAKPEGFWCVWGRGGERGVSSKSPSCTCIPCGCTPYTLSLEVASSAALAAAQYSPGRSHGLAADETLLPGNTFLPAWGSASAETPLLSLLVLATATVAELNWFLVLLAQYIRRFIWWGGGGQDRNYGERRKRLFIDWIVSLLWR